MKKEQLVATVIEKTGERKKAVEAVINSTFAAITESLGKKEEVTLVGFGTFSVSMQKGKTGTVPGTDKTYETKDKYVPKFRPGKALKDSCAEIK